MGIIAFAMLELADAFDQLLGTLTGHSTLEPMTLCNSNNIHTLILLKCRSNLHRLLK
jgi:hypothetical protein